MDRIIIVKEEDRNKAIAELQKRLLKGEEPKYPCRYNYGSGLYEPRPPFGWGQ